MHQPWIFHLFSPVFSESQGFVLRNKAPSRCLLLFSINAVAAAVRFALLHTLLKNCYSYRRNSARKKSPFHFPNDNNLERRDLNYPDTCLSNQDTALFPHVSRSFLLTFPTLFPSDLPLFFSSRFLPFSPHFSHHVSHHFLLTFPALFSPHARRHFPPHAPRHCTSIPFISPKLSLPHFHLFSTASPLFLLPTSPPLFPSRFSPFFPPCWHTEEALPHSRPRTGQEVTEAIPVVFADGVEDDGSCRHVHPHGEGLGGEQHLRQVRGRFRAGFGVGLGVQPCSRTPLPTHLDQPLAEEHLHHLLEQGQDPAVVDADPALQQLRQLQHLGEGKGTWRGR